MVFAVILANLVTSYRVLRRVLTMPHKEGVLRFHAAAKTIP
jgi:hypothetical protein